MDRELNAQVRISGCEVYNWAQRDESILGHVGNLLGEQLSRELMRFLPIQETKEFSDTTTYKISFVPLTTERHRELVKAEAELKQIRRLVQG